MLHSYKDRIKLLKDKDELLKYKKLYSIPYDVENSCLDFINRFCYTFDPRLKDDRIIPFELYPRQEEYIRFLWDCYKNQKEGYIDKCRDMGATWGFIAFSVFFLLFRKNISITFFTFKASECHTLGKPGTLFEKAKILLSYLPDVFVQNVEFKLMLIKNHEMQSTLTGAAGDNPDRGDRKTMVFKDECAFYEQEEQINAALSKVSDCQINISTHSGSNTSFYRSISSGTFPVFTFDWWQNPRHSQEWFNEEKKKAIARGELHIFKREIERNPLASVENILIPAEWVATAKECDIEITGKIISSLDVADEGKDTNAQVIFNGNVPIFIDEWGTPDPNETARRAFFKALEMNADEFRYDNIGVGSGVKAGIISILEDLKNNNPDLYNKAKKMEIIGWSASGKVVRAEDNDFDEKRPNKDFFENAKSQAYYKIREEFLNTYHFKNKEQFDNGKLISFKKIMDSPLFNKLLTELSQPLQKLSASGKIVIDKKNKSKSPNIAEAYMIGRAEVEKTFSVWD